MNLATVIGLPLGWVLLILAFVMEGGNPGSLILPTPFIIILGETFSALLVSFDLSEVLAALLEGDVAVWEKHKKREASVFEAAGGFSPTMGVLGTVLGLITTLSKLNEPEKLGESIATAFIATFYGIGFANLIWLPIGNKLKGKMEKEKRQKEMIIEGVLAIQQGESPKFVGDKLAVYVPEKDRGALESFNEA